MTYFSYFFLDNEKDIIVNLYKDLDRLFFELETPNHHTGNLIRNLAALCDLPLSKNDDGRLVIRGEVPCYIDGGNREIYVFRLGPVKVANIYPDGNIEIKAFIPAISKTLMSQTRDYGLDIRKTIFKSFIPKELKFRSDLHTHMNGNLPPDVMIALGIYHQIRYPFYYVKKLGLKLTAAQEAKVMQQREKVERQFVNSELTGKYLDRKIDDETFINFADLILRNLDNAEENIVKIRGSLSILKDGQAVFTNLEKVYLYRYVFAKGRESEEKINITGVSFIPDEDVKKTLERMLLDHETELYRENSIFQDKLLWIARGYKAQGIFYAEIADTTLVKKYESVKMLTEIHEVMPKIYRETGVMIRFLAAMRRIPLTIVKDRITPSDYLARNLEVLKAVAV
ncbi:MAG: adenosine deaminase, partial [Lachnospiraceae bacterium]|nr:adenosine deaminase [Lachnospiraceae bacterium]